MSSRFHLLTLLVGLITLSGCTLPQLGKRSDSVSDQEMEKSLEAQLSLARLSERHGQLDFAKRVYESAIERDPKNRIAHHRLAVIAARKARFQDAQTHFTAALQLGQPNAELLNDYGYCLYLQDDLAAAERLFREAVKIEPTYKAAHNNLALALGEQGRFDESHEEFRKAVNDAEAIANLAYVKTQMGLLDEAQLAYHQALNLDGEIRPAAEALIQLAKIDEQLRNMPQAPNNVPAIGRSPEALAQQAPARQPQSQPLTQQVVQQPATPGRASLEQAPAQIVEPQVVQAASTEPRGTANQAIATSPSPLDQAVRAAVMETATENEASTVTESPRSPARDVQDDRAAALQTQTPQATNHSTATDRDAEPDDTTVASEKPQQRSIQSTDAKVSEAKSPSAPQLLSEEDVIVELKPIDRQPAPARPITNAFDVQRAPAVPNPSAAIIQSKPQQQKKADLAPLKPIRPTTQPTAQQQPLWQQATPFNSQSPGADLGIGSHDPFSLPVAEGATVPPSATASQPTFEPVTRMDGFTDLPSINIESPVPNADWGALFNQQQNQLQKSPAKAETTNQVGPRSASTEAAEKAVKQRFSNDAQRATKPRRSFGGIIQ